MWTSHSLRKAIYTLCTLRRPTNRILQASNKRLNDRKAIKDRATTTWLRHKVDVSGECTVVRILHSHVPPADIAVHDVAKTWLYATIKQCPRVTPAEVRAGIN